jgi:hypothetical protein
MVPTMRFTSCPEAALTKPLWWSATKTVQSFSDGLNEPSRVTDWRNGRRCGCRPKAPQIRRTVVSEELPRDATHWSTRAMAEQSGLSLGSWSAPPPPARR